MLAKEPERSGGRHASLGFADGWLASESFTRPWRAWFLRENRLFLSEACWNLERGARLRRFGSRMFRVVGFGFARASPC